MKFADSVVPFTPKDAIIGGSVGGLASIILGPFGVIVGLIAIVIAYFRKSSKTMIAGITMTLMGIAYFASSTLIEFMPAPMMLNIPIPETVIKNTVINNTSGVASAFRKVNGVPSSTNAGDVWYNTQDTQYEGYDGSDVVILG